LTCGYENPAFQAALPRRCGREAGASTYGVQASHRDASLGRKAFHSYGMANLRHASRHCERSEAIQKYGQCNAKRATLDCFATLAMTQSVQRCNNVILNSYIDYLCIIIKKIVTIMGRPVKTLKNCTTEQVEKFFDSDENNKVGIKLYAILMLTRGYSSRALTEFYRVNFKQLCSWADRFDAEGIEGLRLKREGVESRG
jgi:hypothetical protein